MFKIHGLASAIVLFFIFVAQWSELSSYSSAWIPRSRRDHLGAECDSIARSIRSGHGFSNPFGRVSGPTSWTAPAFPYFLAGLYWLNGDRVVNVRFTVFLLHCMSAWVTALIVLSEAARLKFLKSGILLLALFFGLDFHEIFQKTSDLWLVMLCINTLWIAIAKCSHDAASPIPSSLCGVGCGVAALCHPIVGWNFLLLTTIRFFWKLSIDCGAVRRLVIFGVFYALLVSPWVIRNYIIFGKLIPIKSNVAFELWQAQCWDDDGVLDLHTLANHPFSSNREFRVYSSLGEQIYLENCGQKFLRAVMHHPLDYVGRVFNRFLAATVYYVPLSQEPKLNPLWIVDFKRVFFWIPFACFGFIVASRQSVGWEVRGAITIYSCMLLPYIFISFYERYGVPLVGIKCLIILYGFSLLSLQSRCNMRGT